MTATIGGAQRRWTMEGLLDGHGQRGRAEADARFHANQTARQALLDLRNAIDGLPSYLDPPAQTAEQAD